MDFSIFSFKAALEVTIAELQARLGAGAKPKADTDGSDSDALSTRAKQFSC